MGTFSLPIQIGDLGRQRFVRVVAVVGTGASDTVIPADILTPLGIEPVDRFVFRLADESPVEYLVGDGRLRLQGRERVVPLVFGPEGSEALLGATSLGIFHLGVDPVGQELIPVPGLLK